MTVATAEPIRASLGRSDEDWLLTKVARQLVRDERLLEYARASADGRRSGTELAAALDRVLSPLGWSELLVPDEPADPPAIRRSALVFQELGAGLNPTPLLDVLLGRFALSRYGADQNTGPGAVTFAVELAVPTIHGFRYTATGDGSGLINGRGLVFARDVVNRDTVICAAHDKNNAPLHVLVDVAAVGLDAVVDLRSLDLTRGYVSLGIDAVPARRLSAPGAEARVIARELWLSAVTLHCAETLGALGRLFSDTVEYTRERIAFGRPVASYQAIKHRLANASLQIETSAALLEHAVDEIEGASPTAITAVSAVKAYLSTAAVEVAEECMQFYGAIGYTWELNAHLFLRRLVTNRSLLGTPEWHQRSVCRDLT